ncbi:hypothetical protein B5X24_HaOG206267 [Helicoverpa armigera]|nr:hypothetical protein B5X24_HaOG206267 [Helicoverpa armigera]
MLFNILLEIAVQASVGGEWCARRRTVKGDALDRRGGSAGRRRGRKGAVRLAEIIRGSLHNRFFPPDAENSSGRGGCSATGGGGPSEGGIAPGGQAECSGAVQRAPPSRPSGRQ